MQRREFITLLSGTAAAWPLAAHAQQPGKLPTIGYLGPTTPAVESQRITAFVQRLRELGWIEGRTIAIEYRWAEGRSERFIEIAAEFVRLNVDVIVTYAPRAQMTKLGEKVPTRVACLPDWGWVAGGVRRPFTGRIYSPPCRAARGAWGTYESREEPRCPWIAAKHHIDNSSKLKKEAKDREVLHGGHLDQQLFALWNCMCRMQ
jgi:hypothetical protein